MQITVEKTEKKRLDKFGNEIKNPVVLAEIERIENKKANKEYITAKEGITLNKLLKHGDSAVKNKLLPNKHKQPTKAINLASDAELTAQTIDKVIEDLYRGINPFESLLKNNISPRGFYTGLNSPKVNRSYFDYIQQTNQERFNIVDAQYSNQVDGNCNNNVNPDSFLLSVFAHARTIFCESCLNQLFTLAEDVKQGNIDSSAYNAITNNLKWIMAKLFPAQYAEKIAVAQDIRVQSKQELDLNKVKELASLIS